MDNRASQRSFKGHFPARPDSKYPHIEEYYNYVRRYAHIYIEDKHEIYMTKESKVVLGNKVLPNDIIQYLGEPRTLPQMIGEYNQNTEKIKKKIVMIERDYSMAFLGYIHKDLSVRMKESGVRKTKKTKKDISQEKLKEKMREIRDLMSVSQDYIAIFANCDKYVRELSQNEIAGIFEQASDELSNIVTGYACADN